MQSAVLTQQSGRLFESTFNLSIIAYGSAHLTGPELAAIRKKSLPGFRTALSPQLLRHSDDQTLSALAAMSTAMGQLATTDSDFGKWAVVSASRNLGRSAFAAVMDKYRSEGPWGVSVQVIPHCTAHAVAGTVSLALHSHGPCIGAGSGDNGEVEALLAAASILRQHHWPGVWVLFSGWSPDLAIDFAGQPISHSVCAATALALECNISPHSRGRIHIQWKPDSTDLTENDPPSLSLAEIAANTSDGKTSWSSSSTSGIQIHVELFSSPEIYAC